MMILMAGERLVKAITGRTMMKFFPRQEFMRKTTTPRGLRHTSPSLRGSPEFLLPRQGLLRPPPLGSTFLKGQLFTMLFGRSVRFSSSSSSSSSSSPVEVEEMTSPPSALVSSGLHPRSPWLMLPPELDTATGEEFDCFYSLLDKQVVKLNRKKSLRVPEGARCFGSTRGWLGFVDPKDCSLYLSNPFSLLPHQQPHSPRVIQLPPFETLAFVVGTVRNPESNVIEKFVIRMQEDGAEHDIWEEHPFCPEFLSSTMPRHFAMSSDPSNEDDCVILTDWDGCREFGFCRPGRDTAWTSWDGPEWSPSEFAYSKKERRFYSIFDFGGIQALDVVGKPPKRTIIFPELHDERLLMIGFHMRQYLVIDESSSDILLVNRHVACWVAQDGTIKGLDKIHPFRDTYKDPMTLSLPYKTLGFDIYKLDCAKKKLEWVNCLGDRVIFLGGNHSFSLSASDFPGLRPNSIYFTDGLTELFSCRTVSFGGHDMGIFNLEDKSISPFYDELKKEKRIITPLYWVPPPSDFC